MTNRKVAHDRKKPIHRTKPWFLYVGLALLLLGLTTLAGTILFSNHLGSKSSGSITAQGVLSWFDAIMKVFDRLGGALVSVGGGIMVWLNIREKTKG